jgi:hypothetical protein
MLIFVGKLSNLLLFYFQDPSLPTNYNYGRRRSRAVLYQLSGRNFRRGGNWPRWGCHKVSWSIPVWRDTQIHFHSFFCSQTQIWRYFEYAYILQPLNYN